MEKFYKDNMTADEYNKQYSGKSMAEIQTLESKRFDDAKAHIDKLHDNFVNGRRKTMLTV